MPSFEKDCVSLFYADDIYFLEALIKPISQIFITFLIIPFSDFTFNIIEIGQNLHHGLRMF